MKSYIVTIFLIVTLSSIKDTAAVNYYDCGSLLSMENLQVENCAEDSFTCNIKINSNTTVSFTLNKGEFFPYGDDLEIVAYLVIRGVKFVLDITPEDPCVVLSCPIADAAESKAVYNSTLMIDDSFAPIIGEIQWHLKARYMEEPLICFLHGVVLNY